MTKLFSFNCKSDGEGGVIVQASEQLKSAQGKPMGSVQADISAVVSDDDKAKILSLLSSLQTLLEAQ